MFLLSFISFAGCFLGEYGENCTKICNHCKNNLSCDTESGRCNSEGCALSGFQMPYCQNCSSGLYGVYCEKTCSEFCKNENCDKTNGACANGCRSGYTGRHCNETCDVREYGQDCGYNCSGNCLRGQACDTHDGTCLACATEFHGIKCDQVSHSTTHRCVSLLLCYVSVLLTSVFIS
ncbi:uncharacterized protein LOC111106877 isoform X1 [Crassostrea virginica]